MRLGLSKRQVIKYKYRHIVYKIYFYIIFLISLAFMSYTIYKLEYAFLNSFAPYAINIGSDAINCTVSEYFSVNQFNYADFIELRYNKNDTIASLQTNSALMNKVKADISIILQEVLDKCKSNKISVPIGSISKNMIFHGIGPIINIKIHSAELTDLVFNDTFESAGINQVRHKIYIEAYVTISIGSASAVHSEVIHDIIPVAETIIVGDVPYYFGGDGITQLLPDKKES